MDGSVLDESWSGLDEKDRCLDEDGKLIVGGDDAHQVVGVVGIPLW